MTPLSFAPGSDESGSTQIGQVARDLWLVGLENFDERADANLVVFEQVNEAQAGVIRERFKEKFEIELLVPHLISERFGAIPSSNFS